MDDAGRLAALQRGLNQPERGLHFAPIRHHSPACAWAVQQLIRDVKPRQVLIEAPIDLQDHIDLILAEDTVPPVAIAVLTKRENQSRLAAYYPFCAHSPEYIALVEGRAIGATASFIDLPSASKAMLATPQNDDTIVVDGEQYFDSGDFVSALSAKIGCRNGFELWDHLFESRLGSSDWKSFLADVGAYCAALRNSTSKDALERSGDLQREAHMADVISTAMLSDGPIVVVVGGFHSPALIETAQGGGSRPIDSSTQSSDSYLIRYGFEALDALSGYAAGLPQPGYYDYLWKQAIATEGAPPWRETALDLLSGFSRKLRSEGHSVTVPAQVEALRIADDLAAMRGRYGASRYDLIDAVRTAYVKGEVGSREVWTERLLEFLRGDAIGNVPASAGSPPIVEDARSRARRLRIDVSDGSRRQRRLDIRRKPSHLRASRFFHAMSLLESSFAELQAGPDFVNTTNTDRLFEEWGYAWSPAVEGRLIEAARLGDSVTSACIGKLAQKRAAIKEAGGSQDIAAMAELFVTGILAGLDSKLLPFLSELSHDIQSHGDFAAVAQTLWRLHNISNASGPLQISASLDIGGASQAAYRRLVYLCDDLPKSPREVVQTRIEALRLVMELLRAPGSANLDRDAFVQAVNRVADANPPPEILGSVLAISLNDGLRKAADVCNALSGGLHGTHNDEADRVGVLRGLLLTSPEVLWQHSAVLGETDRLLCGLSEDEFLNLLPHIRLAFTSLNPRESDRVGASLAALHGGRASEFLQSFSSLSDQDLQRGISLERELKSSLSADCLQPWMDEAE